MTIAGMYLLSVGQTNSTKDQKQTGQGDPLEAFASALSMIPGLSADKSNINSLTIIPASLMLLGLLNYLMSATFNPFTILTNSNNTGILINLKG